MFLRALKGFIPHRGKAAELSNNCATSFKGTSKKLRELYKFISSTVKYRSLSNYVGNEGFVWIINPPFAPCFGELREANIKSVKYHLRRTMGN